ncbi:type VII secretion integral membrane protein EccD [Paractinoplanes durhamensis]|uniref:Type VII secretion integral membrane protein EccD n=1 Tax=Paractinoplanes durhamensis TaxID=113563 RepID=A0ABQ3Z2X0_9ACTN|nr:type VII secretion integral membrane protein EccD [Actinoplanes durhamensis]GIE04182.1 type VII secretion integral membrane protein EccD [Actinoplanes durhamensis]
MTDASTAEMCRLVVCGPDRQIEVAVPASVLVADLLPALLHHLGEGLADNGLPHGGWVLQRIGTAPLDEEVTVAAAGLHDGEVVHLRPRAEQLPEVDFDDLVDGVATGVGNRPGKWRPEMMRWAAQGAAAVLLAVGVAGLAMPGPALPRAAVALFAALVSLAAGAVLARRLDEPGLGVVLAAAAVGFAGVAGLILTGGDSAPQLLAASATAAATAVLAAVLLGPAGLPFVAAATAASLGVAAGASRVLAGLTGGQAAAVVAVLATALVPAVPMLAFRLSGLRLSPLPTKPEHLQEELDPVPAAPLMERSRVVDAQMTALYAGLGAAVTLGVAPIGRTGGWAGLLLPVLLALVWLLSARPMTSGRHRLAQGIPALAALAGSMLGLLSAAGPLVRLGLLAVVPLGVWIIAGFARTMRERRLMPYWGRIGDVLLTVAAVALLPVLLAVLGAYGWFRAIGG